jgi:hypothetical protein
MKWILPIIRACLGGIIIISFSNCSKNQEVRKRTMNSLNICIKQAIEVKKRHQEELMKIPHVLGMGIGLAGPDKNEVIIEVYVEEMNPELYQKLPQRLEDFRVIPIITGKIVPKEK